MRMYPSVKVGTAGKQVWRGCCFRNKTMAIVAGKRSTQITPWTTLFQYSIASTLHCASCLSNGIGRKIDFGQCPFNRVVRTIDFGECPFNGIAGQLISEAGYLCNSRR